MLRRPNMTLPFVLAVALSLALTQQLVAGAIKPANGPVIVRGNKMFNAKTGERFFMKGMTYEYAVSDDYYEQYSQKVIAKNLDGFDFNTVRVYNINPEKSYDKFMADMAARGVYVLVAGSPDNTDYFGKYRYSTIRKDLGPGTIYAPPGGVRTIKELDTCYPALLLEYGKKVARNFAKYDNTLGIIVANEIMQKDLTAAACVKQYIADLKNWMRGNCQTMRVLPLAYAAADSAYAGEPESSPKSQWTPQNYHVVKIQGLLCGDTMVDGIMSRSVDIYLINEYRWCSDTTYEGTYKLFLQIAQGVPIVMGLGEFGCHKSKAEAREWPMVPYLVGSPDKTEGFTNVFSGGLAYSYGEANLDKNSLFPMFTGGSMDPLKQPSYIPSADYTNLKAQYAANAPYLEKAAWVSSDKCAWIPTITDKISATNKLATASGWVIEQCNSSVLRIGKNDTWTTLTRDGMVCADDGGKCSVSVSSKVGTTQEDICGHCKVESGGAKCSSSDECGTHGQCVEVDGKSACQCTGCYSGILCDIKSSECFKLSSSTTAPKFIFAGVGMLIATMLAIFVGLAVVAQKKKTAMDNLGNQVKMRGPNGTPISLQAGATL